MTTHPYLSETSSDTPTLKTTQLDMIKVGTIIDQRWQCVSLLGEGGFGVVFKAVDLKIDQRVVAIKILTLDPNQYPQIIKRFKQEASITSRLRSPHTLTIFDYGQWQNFYYIVSELLIGETLSDLLEREKRLPVLRSLEILMDVCESLKEAHDQHIIHRDIKPDNLFLNQTHGNKSIVKLIDFGIAQLREANISYLTAPMSVMGTPHYMSPEQAQDSATVDPRSDIYSLGIVLYHCLTGAPPFQGSNLYQIIRQHVENEIPSIQFELLESNLAQSVNQLLRKMTQKRKEDRYTTVDLLMKDLALIIASLKRMSQDDVLVLSPQIQGFDQAFDQDEDFKVFQSALDAKATTKPADSEKNQEWFKTYVAPDVSNSNRNQSSKNTDLLLFLISLVVCIVVLYFMHQAGIF